MSSLEQYGYRQELKRALGFWDLLIYGLIFMVPIAPFGIYGYVAQGSSGMVALAYVIGMVGMLFTALSYARMSQAFPLAGSVYAYAQRGIHEHVGFLAGWAILLDYILVPSLLYLVSAAALHDLWPAVPVWLWLIVFIAVNTVINVRGIEMTAKANRIILVLEFIVLALFIAAGIAALVRGAGSGFTWKPLYDPDQFHLSVVMQAVSIAVLSFLGFDGISTLAEETRETRPVVGKATIAALFTVGALFIAQTWIAALIWPDYTRFPNPDTAFYEIAQIAGGSWLRILCILATAFSWGIANALVAQAAISRILYGMGRDRKLPAVLARVHPRYRTPYISNLFVAVLSLAVGLFFQDQISALTSLVNFGALTAFLFLHLAVINHYLIRQKSADYLRHGLFPLMGLVIIGYVWWSLDPAAKKLGLIWLAIGLIYLAGLILRGKKAKLELE